MFLFQVFPLWIRHCVIRESPNYSYFSVSCNAKKRLCPTVCLPETKKSYSQNFFLKCPLFGLGTVYWGKSWKFGKLQVSVKLLYDNMFPVNPSWIQIQFIPTRTSLLLSFCRALFMVSRSIFKTKKTQPICYVLPYYGCYKYIHIFV